MHSYEFEVFCFSITPIELFDFATAIIQHS